MCWIVRDNTKTQGVDRVPSPVIYTGNPTATLRADLEVIFKGDADLSDERRALIERALESADRRQNEDIEEWARRLANDVADAGD